MRLTIIPNDTSIDFLARWRTWIAGSGLFIALAVVLTMVQGLNYGIDFRGGTTIRTESAQPVDVGAYREALAPLGLGDVAITEVFDPTFGPDQNVAQIRIQLQEGQEAVTPETLDAALAALRAIRPDIVFASVESVGPKVSGELIQTAAIAMLVATLGILLYVWARFEWQFALGAVAALVHDVIFTVGIFAAFQIRFDLSIIAALLTIVGYSINDTVVIFDRVRENLRKYKRKPLKDVLNLAINETLPRTFMTSFTTFLSLVALLVLGGDVIRGFVFAMMWGVIVGTYSTVFIATAVVLWLGVKRDWSKPDAQAGPEMPRADA